jgi:hypothetical protein
MSETKKKSSRIKTIMKIVAFLFVGFLLTAGIPKFIQAREQSMRLACMNNLIQILGAKDQWALDHKITTNDTPTWEDLKPYIGRGDGKILKCPQGGVYTIGKVGEYPTCSITNHSLRDH